jgi:uncharacterized membrane protein
LNEPRWREALRRPDGAAIIRVVTANDSDVAAPVEVGATARAAAFERVVFFSDAVFAIAITLLVLDLKVPALPGNASSRAIGDALAGDAPSFLAFALSFAVIGLYWLAHWRKFQLIVRVNQRLLVLNLALLGSVVFIPFPTSLIAIFGDSLSTAIYAISLAVTGILGSATLWYAWRAGLVDPRFSELIVRNYTARGLIVPGVFLVSLLVLAVMGPTACRVSWIAIPFAQAIVRRRFGQRARVHF